MQAGSKVGPYEIVAPLGAGGMGQVWRAHDSRLGRDVALKVLPAEFAYDPDRLQRFEREARATAALNHPNILAVHDIGSLDGVPYIVEELVEGESLRARLRRGPLPVDEVVQLTAQIARGLSVAHDRRVVHRDLKPENIMVTPDGVAKILDFGLAKFVDPMPTGDAETLTRAPSRLTATDMVLGTVAYMSPEQARGVAVDHRADLFALGIVVYEMLTGARPFAGATGTDVVAAILKDDPRPLPATVPAGLQGVVRRCLEKRPEDRFPTAQELLAALQSATSGPLAAPSGAAPASRRLPRVAAVVAVAGLLAALVIVGLIIRPPGGAGGPAVADPLRILVVPFDNLAGDPTLDQVGWRAVEAVTAGLTELESVQVVEWGRARGGAATIDELLEFARGKRAGTIVTGSCSLRGDTLELRARLLETASGKLLSALDPASGPRGDPAQAFETLTQGVKGAIAYHFGKLASAWVGRPVHYEAHREFVAGMQASGFEAQAALSHFERAVEIAPEFWMARLRLVLAYNALREPAKAGEMLASVEKAAAQLSPTESLFLQFVRARREGRRLDALQAASKLLELAPGDRFVSYTAAELALSVNRPREALRLLGDLEECDWREMSKWPQGSSFIRSSSLAHHYLGEHEDELADAQLGLKYYPNNQHTYENLVRAYAALGRLDEVERTVEASLTVPPGRSASPGTVMVEAAEELRFHGHPVEAVRIALRADRWYADHPPADAEGPISSANRAEALWIAQRWHEAREAAEQFVRDDPASGHAPGLLGVIAAREGDRTTAAACDAKLSRFEQPWKGFTLVWRASIAAQLGDRDRAVDLLRDAFAKGMPFLPYLHRYMYLEPLQGYPPAEELLGPRG